MAYKEVGREHFDLFISTHRAVPDQTPTRMKSNGYRVRRLYFRRGKQQIAYVQARANGHMSYHINGAQT